MDKLFEQFLKEKLYLQNASPRTIKYFRWVYLRFRNMMNLESLPTKPDLNNWVILLRESGISVSTVNSYIRGMNSFLSWLYENEHIEKMRMKLLKEPETRLKVFSDSQLKAILSWRPKGFYQNRLYTLLCLAIDTGCRIDELLSLERSKLDLENLLMCVRGKGNKERIIPFSLECRKVLFKFLKSHEFELVFCTRHGGKLMYRNMLRELKTLCERLGITGVRTSFHTLRHGFAINHVKQGGDIFALQRMLGHTSLEITKRYVQMTEDDLKLAHKKTSLLSRLR